jgi:hypothetical protein
MIVSGLSIPNMSSVMNVSKFLRKTMTVLLLSRASTPRTTKNVFIAVAICDRITENTESGFFAFRRKAFSIIGIPATQVKRSMDPVEQAKDRYNFLSECASMASIGEAFLRSP